jgi:hypothetical protein
MTVSIVRLGRIRLHIFAGVPGKIGRATRRMPGGVVVLADLALVLMNQPVGLDESHRGVGVLGASVEHLGQSEEQETSKRVGQKRVAQKVPDRVQVGVGQFRPEQERQARERCRGAGLGRMSLAIARLGPARSPSSSESPPWLRSASG